MVKCTRCGFYAAPGNQFVKVNDLGLILCRYCLRDSGTIWRGGRLNHFTINENWGNPALMDVKLLFLLDNAREIVGREFIIHENGGYAETGHSLTGYHPKGQAVDGHFKAVHISYVFDKLKTWWPGGILVYLHWNNPGFHLDIGKKRRYLVSEDGSLISMDGINWSEV